LLRTTATLHELLEAIAHERQVELFTKWGHHRQDLKRTRALNSIMTRVTVEKRTEWQLYNKLFSISQCDIEKNLNQISNVGC
jgi:hypothetical protein